MKINPGNARGLLVPQGDRPFSFVVYSSGIRDFGVEKEETFRGHLLMTFIATVVLQMLQNKIKQSTFSLDRILARMRTQKAKVFEQTVIPAEPVKEHNDIYKLLGIKPPKELPIKMRSNV